MRVELPDIKCSSFRGFIWLWVRVRGLEGVRRVLESMLDVRVQAGPAGGPAARTRTWIASTSLSDCVAASVQAAALRCINFPL